MAGADGTTSAPTSSTCSAATQDDRLAAGPHSSVLNGGPGQDTQIGGPGDDDLQAAYVETVEEIFFTDEGQDTLVCGGGRDSVFAGPSDSVAADCEVVLRQRTVQTPSTPDPLCSEFAGCGAYQFEWRGSNDRDTIANDRFVIRPARILGRGGDDRLTVGKASPDALFGGSGDDILHGQRGSAINYLDGGSGRDTLLTRDRAQDLVHCGAGRDTAYVDSLDAVADDCERVRR